MYNTIKSLQVADKMNIYQELRKAYEDKSAIVVVERDNLLEAVKMFGEQIRSKKLHTTNKLNIEQKPEATNLAAALKKLNAIIFKP